MILVVRELVDLSGRNIVSDTLAGSVLGVYESRHLSVDLSRGALQG